MSRLPVTIPKQPLLNPAEDYYRLRREGIGFIEQMGSRFWTDYNTHDPGITILEALCYAITDLAYRTGWEMKDLLAPPKPGANLAKPFLHQAFFTAREILTVNPVTPADFRRLLIDLVGVRNAWVICKTCACEVAYYASCEKDQLQLSYQKSKPVQSPVAPQGLYETLLELEADPEFGDLNDRKIARTFTIEIGGKLQPYTLELRFPAWELLDEAAYQKFIDSTDNPLSVTRGKFSRSKFDTNVISDPELRRTWRNVFYLSFSFLVGGKTIEINNATLRIFGADATAQQLTVATLTEKLKEEGATGFLAQYRRKLQTIATQVEAAKAALHSHRNLDEDYCRVKVVDVEDVAVCADVEVKPDADIERVQAEIWFAIEQYFNPPVRFYTWQELQAEQFPVEEIFNGPELSNGFLKAAELDVAVLKTELRTSDIINRLMDIAGVVAVNNLLLTGYDAEGNVIKGKADLELDAQGHPIPDNNKISAAWLLYVNEFHQPRLHRHLSRFLFYKNGLPFLPRMDEAQDTLIQLHGEAERPKIPAASLDLPVPTGTFRHPEEYFPVQYSFPLTYGIGEEGLPSHASTQRRAQARQLKAYLLMFEQLLGNAFAQLAHAADLFSLDPNIRQTYFSRTFTKDDIQGYDDLTKNLTLAALETMTERPPEFYDRRNRFLDHLMARFGEQFGEYALLLTDFLGQKVAPSRLIEDKISFLRACPQISHDRAKAFDYKTNPCAPDNISGLKKRVSLLLGQDGGSNERAIVVEHLLLRPKFSGDALFPACSEGPCATCGDEDPYSFRLTFVMPGWTEPYNVNMEMRKFADRTIRAETPAHILGKICWVGNDGFIENSRDPVVCDVVELLIANGKTASGVPPTDQEACTCAAVIYAAFSTAFKNWYEDKTLTYFHPDDLAEKLKTEFEAKVTPSALSCAVVLAPSLWAEIQVLMLKHFQHLALYGWQFERFEDAWCKWLEANAKFDWAEERLQERVEAILANNLVKASGTVTPNGEELCRCAAAILTKFGMEFYDWMDANIKAGRTLLEDTVTFEGGMLFTPDPITLCAGFTFNLNTATTIENLLKKHYAAYIEVSYRLWIVVNLLSKLRNTYPGATLHDCDDGSDLNPVRLGLTALGNYPLKKTTTSDTAHENIAPNLIAHEFLTPEIVASNKTPKNKSQAKKQKTDETAPPQDLLFAPDTAEQASPPKKSRPRKKIDNPEA